jgi:membrane protein
MLIAPVLLILSSSISVFIFTQLTDFMEKAPILSSFKWMVSFFIKLAPYLLVWTVLTLLYIVMPLLKTHLEKLTLGQPMLNDPLL